MRRLVVGVVVVASGLALSGYSPAGAAARPACDLVTDVSGDTSAGPPQAPVPTSEPALDIVAADVSVSKAWVTTAIRVKKLALGRSPVPDMWRWNMMFAAGPVTYMLNARTGVGGTFGDVSVVYVLDADTATWGESRVLANVKVTMDEQRNEIRATVARSALAASGGVAIGQRLTGMRAYTWHEHTAYAPMFNQPGGEWDIADMAKSTKTYVAGTRSCVKPGS